MVSRRSQRIVLSVAVAAALGIGALLLLQAPPEQNAFAPSCVFHSITGLHCPGCGATRCLYAMLHLHFDAAARSNILALLAIPGVAAVLTLKWWRWIRLQPPPIPRRLRFVWWPKAVAFAVVAFCILRNLPWPPFSWLAPH
ncbi:MAG: DUF2752 domain-containing protein [Verrucomicrobiales bacterium]|nr:DUF2752 domain-containing protein [Verrucomicrobiales bacterium]